MATRTPLVLGGDGLPQQLQAGDSIPSYVAGGVPTRVRQGKPYTVPIDTQINPVANIILDDALIIDGTVVL